MKDRDHARTSSATPPPSDKAISKLSSTSSSSPVLVATPSSVRSMPDAISLESANMEPSQENAGAAVIEPSPHSDQKDAIESPPSPPDGLAKANKATPKDSSGKKSKRATKRSGRKVAESSASDATDSDGDNQSESSSEDEKAKQKAKRKLVAKRLATKKKQKAKAKAKHRKAKKHETSSDDDTSAGASDSDSVSEVEDKKGRRKALRAKAKKSKSKKTESSSDDSESSSSSSSSSSDSDSDSEDEKAARRRAKAKRKAKAKKADSTTSSDSSSADDDTSASPSDASTPPPAATEAALDEAIVKYGAILNSLSLQKAAAAAVVGTVKADKPLKKKTLEFKRVDQVYDMKIHDWTLVESNKEQKDEFDCVFTVRRRLDWDGKYKETQIDVKSKILRNSLQEVFKDCKSMSLVEETPQIDPHTLFHYYDELSRFVKKTLKSKLKKAKKSKVKKQLKQQIAQCKLLLTYIDEDYEATRKALRPMLKAGTITYDLVWALFKPNTIAYTPTYTNKDDPRCFKVDSTYEYESWMTGQKSWVVDGRYLEYDGKAFGLGDHQVSIPAFKGHKKITSLATYPLKYHADPEAIKAQLIARGKKFVSLQGMNYRAQKGIAYMKHKNSVIRFNINGRVMIDPAIFRRINPNYPFSYLKQDEFNEEGGEEDNDSDSEDCDCVSNDEVEEDTDRLRLVMWKDKKGKKHPIHVFQSEIDKENGRSTQSQLEDSKEGPEAKRQVFTEEELLIASPVVLGFAFSEKRWLEFSLSGIDEIQWNSEAFSSLVLPARIKQNLKGLVSSHRFNAARTIDDVIQGKGKGLNVVLHGPPGVGKTLTGESIAEYLKCPLYAVSAGELGTNSRTLETDLNRIMDITHSWGAILLLDEADVFLEARQPHDIMRNSLVSVFLRLTEYYQGILFLTTNRVETFDEAFQSRIHMGIRYENLSSKARREIWKWHIGKVESMCDAEEKKEKEKVEAGDEAVSKSGELVRPFSEANFDELSKRVMNGRQIKNTVKTSQSIALSEKTPFSMEHVKRVLESVDAFEDDMRGGMGYREAMRQYT